MRTQLLLTALLIAPALPAGAQTTCPRQGALNLEIPAVGTGGDLWAQCVRRDLILISTSVAFSSPGSTTTTNLFGEIYVHRIGGRSAGIFNIRFSSPIYSDTDAYARWRGSFTIEGGGGLHVTYGLRAGSAAVDGSLTASTITATGTGNSQYSLQTASGVNVQAGTVLLGAGVAFLQSGAGGYVTSYSSGNFSGLFVNGLLLSGASAAATLPSSTTASGIFANQVSARQLLTIGAADLIAGLVTAQSTTTTANHPVVAAYNQAGTPIFQAQQDTDFIVGVATSAQATSGVQFQVVGTNGFLRFNGNEALTGLSTVLIQNITSQNSNPQTRFSGTGGAMDLGLNEKGDMVLEVPNDTPRFLMTGQGEAVFGNSSALISSGTLLTIPGNLTISSGIGRVIGDTGVFAIGPGLAVKDGTLIVKSTSTTATNPVVNFRSSGNAELLRLQEDGSLGLGTSAPATKLEVNGSAQFGSGATKSTFSALGALSLAAQLTVPNGGTGSASLTANGALFGNGTSSFQTTPAMAAGGLLIGAGTGVVPSTGTLTGTANRITVDSAVPGKITLSGPQDIHSGATPTFLGLLTSSSMTASRLDTNQVSIASTTPTQALSVTGNVNISGNYMQGAAAGITASCSAGQTLSGATIRGGISTGGSCAASGAGDAILSATQTFSGANTWTSSNTYGAAALHPGVAWTTAAYSGIVVGGVTEVALTTFSAVTGVSFSNLYSTYTHHIELRFTQNTTAGIGHLRIDNDGGSTYRWAVHRALSDNTAESQGSAGADTECQFTGASSVRAGDPGLFRLTLARAPGSADKVLITGTGTSVLSDNTLMTQRIGCIHEPASTDGTISVALYTTAGTWSGVARLLAEVSTAGAY